MNDKDIIEGIKQGGKSLERSREILYRKYSPRALQGIRAFITTWNGQDDDAMDLLHDSFLVMVDKMRHGGYKMGPLLHFWVGIARGIFRNKIRRDRKVRHGDEQFKASEIIDPGPEELFLQEETEALLSEMMNMLGEKCFRVLRMWMEDYSMKEIMDEMGMSSEVMVRKTKFKCKEKLIELIESHNINLKNYL